MSIVQRDDEQPASSSNVAAISDRRPARQRKVLEEDDYLGRMATIIKRDFFLDFNSGNTQETPNHDAFLGSERSGRTYPETPATDRTNSTSTSTIRSSQAVGSMRLNEYLDKYTSEDNAYFEKLQRKDLKRHRVKFPWLYTDRNNHNKRVRDQLQLTSASREQLSIQDRKPEAKMIDWHFNPKNSLFYPPNEKIEQPKQSTVNYESSKYMKEPIFKEPFPLKTDAKPRGINRFTDKIGIDGKLLNGSETPSMNGFSFLTAPETPIASGDAPKTKQETNRYYIPSNSPRDDLAHRLYEEKIANKIRTPKTSTRSDSTKTPKSRLDKIF